MAKVGDGTLVKWVDGQDVDAVDINRNFEVLRVANNDTDTKAVDATSTIDQKVKVVQDDLDAKYVELVSVDTDTMELLTSSIDAVTQEFRSADVTLRNDFTSADTDLQNQVNTKITSQETDQKISAAIATVVAGNAVIPVGTTLPPIGDGRIDGEEFILDSGGGVRSLYFYNVYYGIWLGAGDYITYKGATLTSYGVVKLTNNYTTLIGNGERDVPTQKALVNHNNDQVKHVTAEERTSWNAKISTTDSTNWQKIKVTEDNGRAILLPNNYNIGNISSTGFYRALFPTDVPDSSINFYYIEHMNHVSGTGEQYALQKAYSGYSNTYWQRVKINGTWGSWSADLFTSVANGKAAIASAITAKGIATASDAAFSTMATNISNISTDPRVLTGNMGTGIVTSGLNASRTFTIPGLPKTPISFKVSLENTTYVNSSGGTVSYTLTSPAEFVVDLANRSIVISTNAFGILFTISGTSLVVTIQNNTSQAQSVNYNLTSFKAVY